MAMTDAKESWLIFCDTAETKARRKHLQEHLSFALQRRYGTGYSISDVGMHQWGRDLEDISPEFAIIDVNYHKINSPSAACGAYSDVYDPLKVATALGEAGFTHLTPVRSHYIEDGPNLPGRVIARGNEPFTLSMPGPTVWRTVQLFREYVNFSYRFPELIAFLWIWAHSHNIHHAFSGRILTLMAISVFQKRGGIIGYLQDPELPLSDTGTLTRNSVWVHELGQNPSRAYQVDTSFHTAHKLPSRIPQLVVPFFKYMNQDLVHQLPQLSTRSTAFHLSRFTVPDPFLHTNDLALSIPKEFRIRFAKLRLEAWMVLKRGGSLYDVLGPHFPNRVNAVSTPTPRPTKVSIDVEIRNMYEAARPSDDIIANRASTIQKVQSLVRSNFFKPSPYKVRPFGSTVVGLDTNKSDLDLVIVDPYRPRVSEWSAYEERRKDRIYNVKLLGRLLREASFTQVEVRATASVPIVKFRDPVTRIACDLSVGETLGVDNTFLIKTYCDLLPVLRPLLFAIKQWAKPLGLNTPSGAGPGGASFSSYALTLMTIAFCQLKGWLPNIQEDIPKDAYTYHWFKSKPSVIKCRAGFRKPVHWESKEVSLKEALLAWFNFWGAQFKYDKNIISIRDGGAIPRIKPKYDISHKDFANFLDIDDTMTPLDGSKQTSEFQTEDSQTSEAEQAFEESHSESDADNEFDHPLPAPLPQELEEEATDPFATQATWWTKPVIVMDPFIHVKNTTSMVAEGRQRQFRKECSIAHSMLRTGRSFADVIRYAESKKRSNERASRAS
ncbi:hypothetical protein QCA50_004853 [Cerrena zonata]|uniref:polynucleotide adenylyltransferase n=1 Tax=Cerrena zonata TaxID=2478898 RepID=A0AAW0GI28_9APHY